MTIVITTPTGNVGGRIAEMLVEAGESVTLVARNKEKVRALTERGAAVVEGSHSDPAVLTEATRGAVALYLATPPNLGSDDILGFYKTFGDAAAKAISTNRIPHVVHLSSAGAEQPSGTGPIVGLYENEKRLNAAGKHIAHLRPAYFMENTLSQIHSIQTAGQLYTPMKGDTTFPMIATVDIAAKGAELLRDRRWEGQRIVELMGPEDMSYDRVAAVLSSVLDKPLTHVTVPGSALVETIVQLGGTKHMGEALLELSQGIESGHIHFSGARNDENRTPTTFELFARQVLKPAIGAAV